MEIVFEQWAHQEVVFLDNAQATESPDGTWTVLAEVSNQSAHPLSAVQLHATGLDEMATLVGLDEITLDSLKPGERRPVRFLLAPAEHQTLILVRLGVASGWEQQQLALSKSFSERPQRTWPDGIQDVRDRYAAIAPLPWYWKRVENGDSVCYLHSDASLAGLEVRWPKAHPGAEGLASFLEQAPGDIGHLLARVDALNATIAQLRAIVSSMRPKLHRLDEHPEAEQLLVHHNLLVELIHDAIVSQIPITFGGVMTVFDSEL